VKSFLLVSIVGIFLLDAELISAQGTPPPPPAGGHGLTGNLPPEGGTAPLESGLALMLVMGAAYAIKKYTDSRVSET